MWKKFVPSMILCILVLTIAVITFPVNRGFAQGERSIVPYPRDILVEPIDPVTRMPKTSFCIGVNTIDVKLTNNSGYRKYVSVLNRDTSGIERTLYSGWLEPGTQYLSTLMRTQLELTGPAGTEMVRVDVNEYGQSVPGRWVTFYVQDCGGSYPPGPGGYAQLWAWIYPYAIEQGKKGTITLQTNVGSQSTVTYYFEILNSWGQLWKRLPVSKSPYEQYQIKLAVGTTTKPGMLTYTVNLWQESGFAGERRKVATTYFSFRVVTPGSAPMPYEPGYPWSPSTPYGSGYPEAPGTPYGPGYPGTPGWNPYGGSSYPGMPYNPASPYTMPPSGGYPYGTNSPYGYYMAPQGERSIE
jgi:hypothetical protein